MKFSHFLLGVVATGLMGAAHAGIVDTIQYNSGYFVDTDANKSSSPYYRGENQDWGWTHNAIAGSFASATLNISAYDVDASSGEVDKIWAKNNGNWTLVGSLSGQNNQWSYSTFTLDSQFYDDMATGLEVKIDIDNGSDGWKVVLSKSVIATDGALLPTPVPAVPEPETYALMLAGLGLIGGIARRRKQKVFTA